MQQSSRVPVEKVLPKGLLRGVVLQTRVSQPTLEEFSCEIDHLPPLGALRALLGVILAQRALDGLANAAISRFRIDRTAAGCAGPGCLK